MTADDAPCLTPTAQERKTQKLQISDWELGDEWQQSVFIPILRQRTIAALADHLGAREEDVRHAVRPLLGQGLLCDGTTGTLMAQSSAAPRSWDLPL